MTRTEIERRLQELRDKVFELRAGLTGYSAAHRSRLECSLGVTTSGLGHLVNSVKEFVPGTLFYNTDWEPGGFFGTVYCYSTCDQVGTVNLWCSDIHYETVAEAEVAIAAWLKEHNYQAKPG